MAVATEPAQPGGGKRARGGHRRPLAVVALVAAIAGSAAYLLGAWPSLENASVDLRFSLVGAKRPSNIVIVGVDNKTLDALEKPWPFPRSVDAEAVEALRKDGARTIVYDVQFSQPTSESEDWKLYEATARARNVVLATTEVGPHGETNVLGGNELLAEAHAHAGAGNFFPNSSDVYQQYPYSFHGLKSLAVTAAEQASGHAISPAEFDHNSAWIDYPGPVGTVPQVSFSGLVHCQGCVPVKRSEVAGKIVVVGATDPILLDQHRTSVTSSSPMSGPEVQADAISTALQGNPLRSAPSWLALLTIVLAGITTPLCCLKVRATGAFAIGLVLAAAYAAVAQAAFEAHVILVVTYPLATAALASLGALIVSYGIERWERQLADRYGATLEAAVRERTAELRRSATELQEAQLEAIHRLAQAAELKDEDTGLHIERIGRICQLLGLRAGMSPQEAEQLRIASALHDVGKIGVPDRILLKPGKLDPSEWEIMKAHATTGADILSHSRTAIFRLAETIARTHHERWDGAGYPRGLKGTEIPLVGRICAVCDVFDALSSRRPYKEPWPFERVLAEIARSRGTHLDPDLVDQFLSLTPELVSAHAMAASQTTADQLEQAPALGIRARDARPMHAVARAHNIVT